MCPRDRLPRAEHLAEARLTGASRVACGEGAVNGNRQPPPPPLPRRVRVTRSEQTLLVSRVANLLDRPERLPYVFPVDHLDLGQIAVRQGVTVARERHRTHRRVHIELQDCGAQHLEPGVPTRGFQSSQIDRHAGIGEPVHLARIPAVLRPERCHELVSLRL